MRIKVGGRKKLLDLLFGDQGSAEQEGRIWEPERFEQEIGAELPRGTLMFIWDDGDYLPSPSLVVIRDDEFKEFWAWALTYLGKHHSVSGFCRFISQSRLSKVWQAMTGCSTTVRQKGAGFQLTRALSGLVLGEISTLTSVPIPNVESCGGLLRRLLSVCLGRGLMLDYSTEDLEELSRRYVWLSEQVTSKYQVTANRTILEIVLALRHLKEVIDTGAPQPNSALGALLSEYGKQNEISVESLERFLGRDRNVAHVAQIKAILRGPLEGRVEVFRSKNLEFLDEYKSWRRDFMMGYLLSRIRPGTFRHHEMSRSIARYEPGAHYWYGTFAGLHSDSEILNNDFGKSIALQLSDRFWPLQRPNGFRMFEEVASRERIGRRKGADQRLPVEDGIELLPGIVFEAQLTESRTQLNLFEPREDRVTQKRNKVLELLNSSSELLRECERLLEAESTRARPGQKGA